MPRTARNDTLPPNTDRIGFLLYRLGVKITQAYEQRIHPLGFSAVEVGTLTHLASGGTAHVRSVARSLGVSPQTVVNVTLALEKRHLVTRNPSDTDKRVIAVALTEKGRQSIAKVDRIVRKFDRELAKHLGETKVSLFAEDLRRLLELDSL